MKIKFKKLSPNAVAPTKSHIADAGADLTAISKHIDSIGCAVYGTGLAVEIPPGHMGLIFPRSSISKMNMTLTNSVGVVDHGYSGEIMFKFKPATTGSGAYNVGDRIGQLIIMPYPEVEFEEVEDLGESERGDSGFGSSGS